MTGIIKLIKRVDPFIAVILALFAAPIRGRRIQIDSCGIANKTNISL